MHRSNRLATTYGPVHCLDDSAAAGAASAHPGCLCPPGGGLDRQSLWRDEVDAIYFAVRELPATLSMFVQAAQNGPALFSWLAPLVLPHGHHRVCLALSVCGGRNRQRPLAVGRGRRAIAGASSSPAAVAWLGALFMAVNPYQVWYGQEGKMYATITALALLATWLWWRASPRRLAVMGRLLGHRECGDVHPPPHGPDHPAAFRLVLAGLAVEQETGAGLWPGAGRVDVAVCAHGLVALGDAGGAAPVTGFAFVPLPQMLEGLALFQMRGFWTALPPALAGAGSISVRRWSGAGRH